MRRLWNWLLSKVFGLLFGWIEAFIRRVVDDWGRGPR
jgi:hypothetical protein